MNKVKVDAYGTESAKEPMHSMQIIRRELLPHDIEINILYCGICHSDLHAVRNEWGGTSYPIIAGHEIIGKVSKVGDHVSHFKVGDLVAVGCIVDSCRECDHCKEGLEQYCNTGMTFVFGSPDRQLGGNTYGGFSEKIVVDENYTLHVPEKLDLASAAPLLCAGITVYSPLKHWKAGPGKRVGVIGVGGLGHLAIKLAKSMGAQVVVFSTSPSKAGDAKRLGADEVVLSSDADQMKRLSKVDFIIDTVSGPHDVNTYLRLLKVDGSLVVVGLPAEPMPVHAFSIVSGRKSFAGSSIGGIAETQEMLDYCAEHGITAEIELIQIQQINEAFDRLEKGDVHYRFVIDMSSIKSVNV